MPAFNRANREDIEWATETTLDVECAHAMAPGADILLVETPVDETEGTAGFPQIETAEKYVINHHLAEVISQSFGATEQTFPTASAILRLRGAYLDAAAHNVTVIAASGDQGAADIRAITATGYIYYTVRAVDWPASDPLVTAVGGTYVDQVERGASGSPTTCGTRPPTGLGPAASGGGRSRVFARPSWQNGVASRVGPTPGPSRHRHWRPRPRTGRSSTRALPASGVFFPVAGTSEAAPLFAGIVAVADQEAGRSLGFLNPSLYALGSADAPGLVDVTAGDNSVAFSQSGRSYSVTGWTATPGFDLASGWGTVDGADLVSELVGLHQQTQEPLYRGAQLRSRMPRT